MFDTWIDEIALKLKRPLPGREAQLLMAPFIRNPGSYLFKRGEKTKKSAVLILFYPDEGAIKIPLMLRPEYGGTHSGQVSFPGGKKEESDTDLIQTALREAEEEIGVLATDITVLGTLTELYIQASDFDVLPVIGYTSVKPIFKPDPVEVDKVIECDLNLLMAQKVKIKELLIRDFVKIKTPYYDIDGHVVWGATAMMLSELLEVLKL